jgi:hypothetical protein
MLASFNNLELVARKVATRALRLAKSGASKLYQSEVNLNLDSEVLSEEQVNLHFLFLSFLFF